MIRKALPAQALWLIVALKLFWGLNWPMIKLAVNELPVLSFRAACVYGGAAGLFAMTLAARQRIAVPRGAWMVLASCALFNITGWHSLGAYGVSLLDSGRGAILSFTMPLWAMLLGACFLGERITRRGFIALVLGMLALALLFSSEFEAASATPLGTLSMLGAALCWAVGTTIMKRWPVQMATTAFTAWQFVLGGLPLLAGVLLFDLDRLHPVSMSASIGLAYNILIAFFLGHWAWVRLISIAPAGVSALSILGTAPIGVFSGMLLLGESPQWRDYAALLLVCVALAVLLLPTRRHGSAG